jgi:protein-S-isoprenylcysteine O-methyltransferase Ste14
MKYVRGLSYIFGTLAIYLGLPLLGWGIGAIPAFMALAPRLGYAVVVIPFSLAIGWQGINDPEGVQGAEGHGQEGKRVRRQTLLSYALTTILFVAMFFLPLADRHGHAVLNLSPGLRWAGVIVSALGYGLIFWSGLSLGRMYSAEVTIQRNHHLITAGLYRHIRHPRYLGILCLALGVALVYRSWVGLLLVAVLPLPLVQRIYDEEALMHREFGAEWEDYCQRSWRLIPHLY